MFTRIKKRLKVTLNLSSITTSKDWKKEWLK